MVILIYFFKYTLSQIKMRFWNYKSDEFYNLYSQIFDSNFSIEKKKVVLKALFSGEYSLNENNKHF